MTPTKLSGYSVPDRLPEWSVKFWTNDELVGLQSGVRMHRMRAEHANSSGRVIGRTLFVSIEEE